MPFEPLRPQWNSKKPLKRAPLRRRKGLNRVSKSKHRREARFVPRAVSDEIKARSGGRCEFVNEAGQRCNCKATCFQHLKKKSQGGKNTVENLKHSCWPHNEWAETYEGKKLAPKLGWTIL